MITLDAAKAAAYAMSLKLMFPMPDVQQDSPNEWPYFDQDVWTMPAPTPEQTFDDEPVKFTQRFTFRDGETIKGACERFQKETEALIAWMEQNAPGIPNGLEQP